MVGLSAQEAPGGQPMKHKSSVDPLRVSSHPGIENVCLRLQSWRKRAQISIRARIRRLLAKLREHLRFPQNRAIKRRQENH